jgi:sugar (pentulose or hexulose) kinase
MEVQIYRGYWMLSWFSKNFASEVIDEAKIQKMAVEELLNKRLGEIPPGSDGLVLQPYWGPGLRRPLAKGGIIGFSDTHTREHLYRAIIEGIGYALKEGLLSIEKSQHHKVKELRISGGGSQSDIICQITADIFNLPVSRVQTFETTSLGAAIATFTALGEFESIDVAIKEMSHKSVTFVPNEEVHKQYNFLYKKAYVTLYPHAKDIYKEIKRYNNKYGKQ